MQAFRVSQDPTASRFIPPAMYCAGLHGKRHDPFMASKSKAPQAAAHGGTKQKRIRKIFGDIHEVVQMPNLIEIGRASCRERV